MVRLFSKEQSTGPIDALWQDYSQYLAQALGSLAQALSFRPLSPFEPHSERISVAQKALTELQVSAGLKYLIYANNCLSELRKAWPKNRKALSLLASALDQYRAMFSLFSDIDKAIDSGKLQKVGDASRSFKKYATLGDQLLRDGLTMLNKELDIQPVRLLASTHLRWDPQGNLSHTLTTDLDLDEYALDDVLAASVPMLLACQLGVLTPLRATWLCGRLLTLLEEKKLVIKPISTVLSGAQINLMMGNQLYLSFHPYLPPSAYLLGPESQEDSRIEDGVCQLIHNYASYATQVVAKEFVPRIRAYILAVMSFYLENVVTEIKAGRCQSFKPNPNLQAAMVPCSTSLYSNWESSEIPSDTFLEEFHETTKKMLAWASLHLVR